MAPDHQKAILVSETGWVVLGQAEVPKLAPGKILVKIIAAAQNPADWKGVTLGRKTGAVVGCDFAGTVEEIGPGVPPGIRTVGERVAGFVRTATSSNGAFAEYVAAPAEVVVHVPDEWSFEDAAQLGIAPFTAAQTLFITLNLPTPLSPTAESTPILISGGSSSVGLYAIQLAKLSGLRVIATASPRNFDLLKSYGADEVYDYRDPDAARKIKESTRGQLKEALDCIGEDSTPTLISNALSDSGGVVAIITKYDSPRAGVKLIRSVVFSLLGEVIGPSFSHRIPGLDAMHKAFDLPFTFTPTAKDIEQGRNMTKLLSETLASGKIKPNPVLVLPDGLASVPEGLQYMKDGKVSAQKITYRISDTPTGDV